MKVLIVLILILSFILLLGFREFFKEISPIEKIEIEIEKIEYINYESDKG